jgi:hypothetical protein
MFCNVVNNESICVLNSNNCCSFNYCQYFVCEKMSIVQQEFWNLLFTNNKMHVLNIFRRLHQRVGVKKWRFVTIQDVEICEATWYKIVGILQFSYLFYK